MPLSLAEIEREATQLTPSEIARLIGSLIASLEPTDEDDVEAAWEEEVHDRSNEIRDGRVKAGPVHEALDRVRQSLSRGNTLS